MKAKILLIDDNSSVLSVIREYLARNGYEVIEAESGKEGLEKIKSLSPDLVTIDLVMPEMDGYVFLEEVKNNYPDLPVVIVTGIQGFDNAVKGLFHGAWDYIKKPVIPLSVLLNTIEKNLEKVSLIRQNREYQENLENSLKEAGDNETEAREIRQKLFPPEKQILNNLPEEFHENLFRIICRSKMTKKSFRQMLPF